MAKYILKRISYMILTLFIITSATFFLMHSIPGRSISIYGKESAGADKRELLCEIWIR